MAEADSRDPSPASDPRGHRQRLRERFISGGASALAEYELLEMLLFGANPRGDTKPLAKALIQRFGNFAGAIAAEPQELLGVPGMGEVALATLKCVEAAALLLAQQQVMGRSVLDSWDKLVDYCRAATAWGKTEQFRVLFLDRKNALIADEKQQSGTVDHTPVYPREVIKRGLELGASAMILVHNHPSGDPTPSRADIEMTREIQRAGAPLGITLHDHLVIGRAGHASFRSLGLI